MRNQPQKPGEPPWQIASGLKPGNGLKKGSRQLDDDGPGLLPYDGDTEVIHLDEPAFRKTPGLSCFRQMGSLTEKAVDSATSQPEKCTVK